MTKILKDSAGVVVERGGKYFRLSHSLSDLLAMSLEEAKSIVETANKEIPESTHWLAPVDSGQEVWACGVTYLRSKVGRMEESDIPDLYSRVYDAERPEIFYKTAGWRVIANGEKVGIRKDSGWDVPEGEVVLVGNAHEEIFGYAVGNDVSSRSIEGENTLYLPQAKAYEKACSLGSWIVPAWDVKEAVFPIAVKVERAGTVEFQGESSSSQLKRTFADLMHWMYKTLPMPHGVFLFTGTGVVPDASFTLHEGDVVTISAGPLGTLVNTIEYVAKG